MNFAVWGRLLDDDVPLTPPQRAARWAVGALNPFSPLRPFRDLNAAFDPEWCRAAPAPRLPRPAPPALHLPLRPGGAAARPRRAPARRPAAGGPALRRRGG